MLGRWLSVDEFTVDVASALEAALAVTTTTGRDGCNVWNPPRLPLLPRRLGRRREGRRTLDPVAATMVGMAHSDIVAVPDRMARRCLVGASGFGTVKVCKRDLSCQPMTCACTFVLKSKISGAFFSWRIQKLGTR